MVRALRVTSSTLAEEPLIVQASRSGMDLRTQMRPYHYPYPTGGGIMETAITSHDGLAHKKKPIEIAASIHRTLHQIARDGDVRMMRYVLDHMGSNMRRKINQLDEDHLGPLHYAARFNFVELVKILVEKGADVNLRGEDGLTPLHFSARYKKTRAARISDDNNLDDTSDSTDSNSDNRSGLATINEGPKVYHKIRNFATQNPLGQYIQKRPFNLRGMRGDSKDDPKIGYDSTEVSSTNVIPYLAGQGGDVNSRDNFGLTPLHYAAMRGNEVAAKELLHCRSINIEARDTQEMTPMHLAAIHGSTEIVQLLIEAGANLRVCDSHLATPLHRASMEGNLATVRLLLETAEKQGGPNAIEQMVSDLDISQNSPLHLAIDHNHEDIIKVLIDKGADVTLPRQNFTFPLQIAAVAGNERVVRLLLRNGASIDCLNSSQKTPLHRAAEFNHVEIIELLLESGANIEQKDKDNFTPLLIAAFEGHVESLQCLLRHGADIGAIDKNDKTAIYLAAQENRQEILAALLEDSRSKDLIERSDRYGQSPLHVAAMKGFLNIVQFLLDKGAQIDHKNEDEKTSLHLAAQHGRTKVVRELVRRNKQTVNSEDEDSNTPLHLAASEGHEKVIKVLLEAGANVEARNSNQFTALDCSAAKGWMKSTKALLAANSPIDPPDKIKTTPLHIAASRGHVEVVELLMEAGASVSKLDDHGQNCFEVAVENSHKNVALAIINSSSWDKALRNSTIDSSGFRNTPIRRLIKKLPDVAEKVFNKCTRTSDLPADHPKFSLKFNYEFLDDTYVVEDPDSQLDLSNSKGNLVGLDTHFRAHGNWQREDANCIKTNHPLMVMVRSKRQKLLAHPLCMSLIHFKWIRFGRYVYYFNLLFYLVFLIFLTGYILTTPPPPSGDFNENSPNGTLDNPCFFEGKDTQNVFTSVGKCFIMILAGIHLLKEFFQLYQLRARYFGFENLLEWACYVGALLLVIDFSQCSVQTGVREKWQWELGAISIFLAWLNLVIFIRKFPFLGIYVVMFTDVFKTFLKVFIVFSFLIVGFAISLMIVLHREGVMNMPKTILHTSVMMLGEFNFDDLFGEDPIPYPISAYAIFVVFLILMPIITMNLLVGLAVDDIKGVQEQAELKRLAMQVELVLNVESILPKFLIRQFKLKQYSIQPNHRLNGFFRNMMAEFDHLDLSNATSAYNLKAEKFSLERIEEKEEGILSRVDTIQASVTQLQNDAKRLESLLKTLIQHKGLRWEDEDEYTSMPDLGTI